MLAMANNGGGIIIFGVKENEDNTFDVLGLDNLKDTADISNSISRLVSSSLDYEVFNFVFDSDVYEATGMILGPHTLDLLDADILGISEELRKIALIIILTRAGLGLDLTGLKKTGRPAFLMCFVPASFEALGVILLGTRLMGLTVLEAAVLGAVLAAVSPAVVVPRMVRLMEEGYGKREGIPQMILAGASVDDVYVIVLFSTFVGMMQGEGASILQFVNIPVSIFFGIAIGLFLGVLLAYFFKKGTYTGYIKSAYHFEHFIFACSN